jgi:outer membrane protein OmpA-like peptidoglycan-associated protein/opacity protein-like surface antigen
MRRLAAVAGSIALALTGSAFAEGGDESSGVTETTYGPSNIEAGIYLGGFISNYYHQFYDPDAFSETEGSPNAREELDRVSPEFGGRFAVFPNRNFGVEGEASVIMASTKMSGDGAQIYGLGAQAVLQVPGRVTPYLGLGFSLRHTSSDDSVLGSDTDFPLHIGGGARFWLSKAVALRADLRFIRGPSFPHDGSYTLNASYGEFSLGVSFNPSPKKEVPPPPPVDPDPDKDGVLDPNDACPTENGGSNPDGCPTRDKDSDGIVDKDDKCIDQAETVNKWDDQDGCPDTVPDSDTDGFDDLTDKCKDQAEDKDAFQDDDGCPDPDNDGDGVLDAKDKCPATTGPVENNGCPDTDGDGDGIVDRLDNCPEEKGTEANRGCKNKQLVVITKNQLQILDQVKFVTGSAKLSPASNKLLDNVARVLLAHLEIWKVRVEGHTDNVGNSEKNMKLSQDRAQSVVAYLVKKGVAPERLEAQGFGDTKPIEDNTTAKGRTQNRRVEFNIVNE